MSPPTTVLGAFLTLILLLPGLLFTRRREWVRPDRRLSAFREVTDALFASAAALLFAAILVYSGARLAGHGDFRYEDAILSPKPFLRDHAKAVPVVFASVLLLACITAWVAAERPRLLGGNPVPAPARVQPASAWWLAFSRNPAAFKFITCRLDDGSMISGVLNSYSSIFEETGDRDLLLVGPLTIRSPGSPKIQAANDLAVISARRIVWMRIEYVDEVD